MDRALHITLRPMVSSSSNRRHPEAWAGSHISDSKNIRPLRALLSSSGGRRSLRKAEEGTYLDHSQSYPTYSELCSSSPCSPLPTSDSRGSSMTGEMLQPKEGSRASTLRAAGGSALAIVSVSLVDRAGVGWSTEPHHPRKLTASRRQDQPRSQGSISWPCFCCTCVLWNHF